MGGDLRDANPAGVRLMRSKRAKKASTIGPQLRLMTAVGRFPALRVRRSQSQILALAASRAVEAERVAIYLGKEHPALGLVVSPASAEVITLRQRLRLVSNTIRDDVLAVSWDEHEQVSRLFQNGHNRGEPG